MKRDTRAYSAAYRKTEAYAASVAKHKASDKYKNTCKKYEETVCKGMVSRRYSRLLWRAKKNGRAVDISLEQYARLLLKGCEYCGTSVERGHGYALDRIDSRADYTVDNVVPCCGECNRIKSNRYSAAQMVVIGAVLRQFKDKL